MIFYAYFLSCSKKWASKTHSNYLIVERNNQIKQNPHILADTRDLGAGDVTRTHDLLITNQLHYRLCYTSILSLDNSSIIQINTAFVKMFFHKSRENALFFIKNKKCYLKIGICVL